jgi:CHAT domain-containing protein/Tfp pilus assembly protein PilF
MSRYRGDLALAEELVSESLSIARRIGARGLVAAGALTNLGTLACARGDYQRSERLLREALPTWTALAPGSIDEALTLSNLGAVSFELGELEDAAGFYRKALDIDEQLAPQSLDVAADFNNLGEVSLRQGDAAMAKEHHGRALAIQREVAPGSLDVAFSLTALGEVAEQGGNWETAAKYHAESLTIREAMGPGSLGAAQSRARLARVHFETGDLDKAKRLTEYALETAAKLAPLSGAEARYSHQLGRIVWAQGEKEHALLLFERAVEAVEAQQGRAASSTMRQSSFRSQFADLFADQVSLLTDLGRHADAFHAIERARAQGLLQLLAERDLVFEADVPPDLDLRRRHLAFELDQMQAALSELSPIRDAEQITELQHEVGEIRRQQQALREEVRRLVPRQASFQTPRPLGWQQARSALDPGTLLVSFSVGSEETIVTAVGKEGGLRVTRIEMGEADLRDQVERFRFMMRVRRGRSNEPQLRERGALLYETLLGPVEDWLEAASRILVIPDGPLHSLPFAALVRRPADCDAEPQYLMQWKPLHVAVSSTVYAELLKGRADHAGRPEPGSLIAVGDPDYGAAAPERMPDRGLDPIRGSTLAPLPASRAEVEAIQAIWGDSAMTILGPEATEERVKAVAPGARVLHLATHGLLDERFPLNSSLALTPPEELTENRDNGFLQAWEILEELRLEADLVTLSACNSGRGKEVAGEGLLGLSFALQFAGARSILASLWSVSDQSTSILMARFYTYLAAGKSKDEALRQAQLDLLTGPVPIAGENGQEAELDASHPFHWAAFQLLGDWL